MHTTAFEKSYLEKRKPWKTNLSESGSLGVRARVGERVLIVVVPVAISGNDDDAEYFG